MTSPSGSIQILSRAIDQAGDVLAAVHEDQFADPTPCSDWDVARLAAHLAGAPTKFLAAARGEEVDWSNDPPLEPEWASSFRAAGDDLIHHWHEVGEDGGGPPAPMSVAELAVHTWDLARAIGWERELDEGVAQCGLDFMSASLTDELRGDAFRAQVEVADDASAVDRLAAFAGRRP